MELAHATVGLVSLKSAGQGARLETQAGVDTAVWRQNFIFSEEPQCLLLKLHLEISGGLVVDSPLPVQGVRVRPLVRRSKIPHAVQCRQI